ncbi:MAG: lipoyl(octanoyl) transferase LipB [Candidatus Hydrogenedentes bacterium]|nr:lipoyl(octanoyl) transferase LipB [Candidatus Hydrogenedentota bacterium]
MPDFPPHALETIRIPAPVGYAEMLDRQLARHAEVAAGQAPNTLYLLEHRPVVTLGKDSDRAHLLLDRAGYATKGIELLETSRGGDVTYHGPGQLVAYPILNLQHWKPSVGWYLRTLEAVIIDVLAEFGLPSERVEGLTGVWVRGAKVAAIGIGVRRWTTFHGIALNVNPNMAHFGAIVPCGIADRPVTSLTLLLGAPPPFQEVEANFERCFRERFECD